MDINAFARELVDILEELRLSNNVFRTRELLEFASERVGCAGLYIIAEVQNNWYPEGRQHGQTEVDKESDRI